MHRISVYVGSLLALLRSQWNAASLADGSFGLLASHRHPSRWLMLMAPLLLVTGCLAQSSIQASYMDAQDDCRSQAEDKVSDLPDEDEMSARQRSAALVDQFSDCMNKAGWHVARPAKPTVVAQPAQPLPGQPSGVITTVRPPVVVQQPQPVVRAVTPVPAAPVVQQPVHTETTPLQPSRSTTPLNPTDQPPPASYEPSGAGEATDLNAVGRHF